MHPDIARHVLSALRQLRVSWSFMVAASLALAGLGLFASPIVSPQEAPHSPWTTVLAALGMLSAGATLWADRTLITPVRMAALMPVSDAAVLQRHLFAGHLVLWSLAQVPALLGFAQLFLDGTLGAHLVLCAVSLATLARLMPTQARIHTRMQTVLR